MRGAHFPHRHQTERTLKKRSLHRTGLLALQLAVWGTQRAVGLITVGQSLTTLKVKLGACFAVQL